ncbi:MAG: ABC transporter ATP-binding protein [Burkholderiales bacterium]
MFAIHDLRHAYDGKRVLEIADWTVPAGGQWLVLGPSGSGKSTLLHIVAGILRPTAGRVSVADQDLAALKGAALDRFRGRHIGIVLQRLHLVASLNVLQNVLLAPYLAGLPQDAARAREVLTGLGIGDKFGARPAELSQGQAQRVAIARAVVNRPQLLLADEPTANLDDVHAAEAIDLLSGQAQACGATLLIATHDQRVKARIAHHRMLAA